MVWDWYHWQQDMGQQSDNNKLSYMGIEMEREMQNVQGKNPKSSFFKKGNISKWVSVTCCYVLKGKSFHWIHRAGLR